MSNERIIERVRKLLALAGDDGATDGEIQNAMQHAQRLMGEHHLTEQDLAHEPQDDYSKVDNAAYGRYSAFVGKMAFSWELFLANFVESFVGVPCYIENEVRQVRKNGFCIFDDDGPRYGKAIVFYGVAEDAMMAVELYDELRILIATMATGRWGGCYRGDGAAYAEGFVSGLRSRLNESRRTEKEQARIAASTSSTALVLVERRDELVKYKSDKANDWLKKTTGWKLRKGGRRNGSSGSHEARTEGVRDGRNTDVSTTRRKKLGA